MRPDKENIEPVEGETIASPSAASPCALCGPRVELGHGRWLQLRHGGPGDADEIRDLFEHLGPADRELRFFNHGRVPIEVSERWARIAGEGGLLLVLDLIDGDARHIVAEAGYAMRDDGDGELGITVDPEVRGWVGPWVLAALFDHASRRGVDNVQAIVRIENGPMMALARHRGYAVLGHPEWGIVRLTMSTSSRAPAWPPKRTGRRVVVETDRSRWGDEDELRSAGFEVALCPGASGRSGTCPVLRGERCPLVDEAEAVVVDFGASCAENAALVATHRRLQAQARIVGGDAGAESRSLRRSGPAELQALLDEPS